MGGDPIKPLESAARAELRGYFPKRNKPKEQAFKVKVYIQMKFLNAGECAENAIAR